MKVRMLTSIAGPWGSAGVGEEIEVDDLHGERMINAGQAEKPAAPEPVKKGRKKAPVETVTTD